MDDGAPLDVSAVIVVNTNQLNADDLLLQDITVKITDVSVAKVKDQPVTVKLDGGWKPWKPCKTMVRVLAQVWGLDARKWIGRSLVLYREPSVTWGGSEVGGIRIRAMSHIRESLTLSVSISKTVKLPMKIGKLASDAGSSAEFRAWSVDVRSKLKIDPDKAADFWKIERKVDLRTNTARAVFEGAYGELAEGPTREAFLKSPFGAA